MTNLQILHLSIMVYVAIGMLYDLLVNPDAFDEGKSDKNEMKMIFGNVLLWPFHVLFGMIAFGEIILTFAFAQALKRVKV